MSQVLYAIIVVLHVPRTAAGLIAFAQLVVQKMTGNAYFPAPTPALSAVTSAIEAYASAVSASQTTKGLKGLRASTKRTLIGLLNQLCDYVGVIASANPELALQIAESAGMTLKAPTWHYKGLISVVQGALSGTVVCRAKAPGIPTNYFWSYSLDQKTWTDVPLALTATITLTGLTPGQTYYFRYHTMNRKGTSDPSQVVSLMVK